MNDYKSYTIYWSTPIKEAQIFVILSQEFKTEVAENIKGLHFVSRHGRSFRLLVLKWDLPQVYAHYAPSTVLMRAVLQSTMGVRIIH